MNENTTTLLLTWMGASYYLADDMIDKVTDKDEILLIDIPRIGIALPMIGARYLANRIKDLSRIVIYRRAIKYKNGLDVE